MKLLTFVSFILLYFFVGWSSLNLATFQVNTSPIWPASGLAIGGVLLFGRWLLPAVFVGAFLTNITVGTPLIGLFLVASGNTLEAFIGATILVWILDKSFLKNYSEFFAITMAAMVASFISSTVGVLSLFLLKVIQSQDLSYLWYTWWSGDVIGTLLIVPLFSEIYLSQNKVRTFSLHKFILSLFLIAFMVGVIYLVFIQGYNQAYAWVLCPVFILVGISLGPVISRGILIPVALYVIHLTAQGLGPFQYGHINLNLISIQCLLYSYAFAILFVKPHTFSFKIGPKFLIGNLIGWTSLFFIIFMTSNNEKKHMLGDLTNTVEVALTSIKRLEGQYEVLLSSAKSLVLSNPNLTVHDWNEFGESLDIIKKFSSINGLAYVRWVEKKDLPRFEKELTRLGVNHFKITTLNPEYSEQFNDRFIMTFITPYEQNKKAIGLDIGSERNRREAAWSSRKLKETFASHPIHLVQNTKAGLGFAVYHPVWKNSDEFLGWVSLPVVSSTFFSKALNQFSNYLHIKVSSGNQLLYENSNDIKEEFKENDFFFKRDVLVFGSKHTVEFYPRPELIGRNYGSLPFICLLLCVFMMFVSGFLLEQIIFNQKAEGLIQERTKELEVSKIQLIHSAKMASLGEMASGMAHEINNPLTIILGKITVITTMLEELEINHPALFEEIKKIKSTTGRIGRIVKGLKTFSRGSSEDPFEATPVTRIVQETLDLCSERLKNNDIELEIDEIPQRNIICRPGQISQVLLNLLNNANDAVENLPEKWIRLSFSIQTNNLIQIFVTDSGPGISEEVAERIMEPFFTTKEVRKGTGLGLSIAKNIIDAHGGRLWLDLDYPHTRFVIELRLEEAS